MEWNWNLHMTYKRWQHKSFVFGRSCNYRLSKATLGLRRSEDPTPEASDSPTNSTVLETWRRRNLREGKGSVWVFGFGFAIWLEFEGEFEEVKTKEGERERLESIRHRRDAATCESELLNLTTRQLRCLKLAPPIYII